MCGADSCPTFAQAVEIQRLNGLISDLEENHKIQMSRVAEASDRYHYKPPKGLRRSQFVGDMLSTA